MVSINIKKNILFNIEGYLCRVSWIEGRICTEINILTSNLTWGRVHLKKKEM